MAALFLAPTTHDLNLPVIDIELTPGCSKTVGRSRQADVMLDDPSLSYLRAPPPTTGEKRRQGAIHLLVPTLTGGYRCDVIIEAANLKALRELVRDGKAWPVSGFRPR